MFDGLMVQLATCVLAPCFICYGLAGSRNCRESVEGAGVRGTVVDISSGESVPSATVQLVKDGAIAAEAATGAEGQFLFDGVPAGLYVLRAEKSGYVDLAPSWSGSRSVRLAQGQQATVRLRLTRTAVITGRVFGVNGELLRGVKVTAIGRRHDRGAVRFALEGAPVFTDDLGVYRIHGLVPGVYGVAAVPDESDLDGNAFAPVYYPGNLAPARAEFFEVNGGETRDKADLALKLTPTFTISGSVRNFPADWRAGQVAVSLVSMGNPPLPIAVRASQAEGQYRFEGIPPGVYQLIAWGPIVAWGNRGPMAGADGRMGAVSIDAGVSDLSGVDVHLQELAVVEVSVVLDECRAGARVVLAPLFPLPHTRPFNAPAAPGYTLRDVPQGRYRVELEGLRGACHLQDVLAGEQRLDPETIEISGNTKLKLVLSNAAGSVSGNVTSLDGRAAEGAIVRLVPSAAGRAIQTAAVQEGGLYEFTQIPPGEYRLVVGSRETLVRIVAGQTTKLDLRVHP